MPLYQKKRTQSRNIATLLTDGEGNARRLYDHARHLIEIQSVLKTILPAPINQHITVANLNEDALILHVDSAAWAARLRFHIPEILSRLNTRHTGKRIKTITPRIIPNPGHKPDAGKTKHVSISAQTARFLQNVAASIDDPELRDTFLKLSRHAD